MVTVPEDLGGPTAPVAPEPESAGAVEPAAFRALMGCYPTGVTVVTTIDDADCPHGMTCTSMSSVTLDPPTLLVSLHADSGTLRTVRATGTFAVNLLHHQGRRAAEVFSAPVTDRFTRVRWCRSAVTGLPWLIDDSLAIAECRVVRTLDAVDHVLVLGRVVGTDRSAGRPLLRGMRRFAAWPAGR
jgi:flavin reductase (DIM6/NTAB) family NADH-FMN oxidoreductase RutF